ncbi:MAG: DUF1501 domain-containing protein [Isosphaeraceae bacterium]|nr:DUF1501 domain-containing protein [Isosphaeraceae bacterium]
MSVNSRPHRHRIGIRRRELLQVGWSALLSAGIPSIASSAAAIAQPRRAKSVILVFQTGAPSQIDTLDPKPDAPEEIRGTFRPIDTRAPGMSICEHLPMLAARADKFSIVRSMTHPLPSHEHATHMMLTGIDNLPPGSTHMASRNDWPCYASGLDFVRPRNDGIPNGVNLPTYLNNGYGFSGQHAGVLGPRHDPWHIRRDPAAADFQVDEVELPLGLSASRLFDRKGLLEEIESQTRTLEHASDTNSGWGPLQDKALSMLTSSGVKRAFQLDREDPRTRDRYGRHMFGQSLLLARRLIEANVPIVQANMGHMNNWDTHTNNCGQLAERLLPPLDRGLSALLDDLESRGMLEDTLVVMVGEFGRTPRIGQDSQNLPAHKTGRDHWSGVFSALFAGGGTVGGRVVGRSDRIGAYPASRGYTPADLGATIYRALGIDPETMVADQIGRPLQLNRGEPIAPLFDGSLA